jgi:hypothetical protein
VGGFGGILTTSPAVTRSLPAMEGRMFAYANMQAVSPAIGSSWPGSVLQPPSHGRLDDYLDFLIPLAARIETSPNIHFSRLISFPSAT